MKAVHILFFLVGIIILVLFPKWLVDDSSILFRYVDNFIATGDLVYNQREFLEGYTGITLILLLIALPFEHVVTVWAIAVISFFVGGYFLYKLTHTQKISCFILLCYFLSPAIYTHIYSGLETILFSTLLLSSYYFWKEEKEYLLLVSLVLLTLTRPEGMLFTIFLLVYDKKYLKIFTYYFLFVSAYLIWKYYYYGDILPNSFYRKSWNVDKLQTNLKEFWPFFFIYILIPFTWYAYSLVKKISNIINWRVSLFIAVCVGYYLNSNLEMNYSGRFFFHLFPLFLAMIGTTEINENNYGKKNIIYFLVATQLVLFTYGFQREISFVNKENRRFESAIKPAANYINQNFAKDKKLAVYFDAGYIPYKTGLQTLDVSGLLNKDLAANEYRNKKLSSSLFVNVTNIFNYRLDYLFNYNPDVVVICTLQPTLKKDTFIKCLNVDQRWKKYELTKLFGDDDYFELIYTRKTK